MAVSLQTKTKREFVKDKLREWIGEQGLRSGDRIVSDNKLAKMFHISPLTAHRALSELENEGLLERIKGKGTFIGEADKASHTAFRNYSMLLPAANLEDPEINRDCWHIVQRYQQAIIEAIGCKGSLSILVADERNEKEVIRQLSASSLVFMSMAPGFEPFIKRLSDSCDALLVGVNMELEGVEYLRLLTRPEENTRMAVSHLAEHGYRRIAFIGGSCGAASMKLSGYRKALEDWGLEYDEKLVVTTASSQNGGARGASVLLNRGCDFDAVFVDTDLKALGAMEFFSKNNMSVPGYLGLAAYDGLEPYLTGPPYLTSVCISYREMVGRVFEEVEKFGLDRKKLNKEIEFTGHLHIGNTCGCGKMENALRNNGRKGS